jgi:Flp pilus assembly protein TadG
MIRRCRDERGLASIELVLLTPVLLLALGFVVVAGRLGTVRGDVAAAARDAARAASMASSYEQAATAATTTATAVLGGREVTCRTLEVALGDPGAFRPGGQITVDISCQVSLADVAIPGLPGTRTVGARSVEVIDTYRAGP